MSKIALLGATGSLGSQVARLALAGNHELSVLVRDPERLAPEVARGAAVTTGDLMELPTAQFQQFLSGHDALVSCAGQVSQGQAFVDLFERVVSTVESLPAAQRPVCWMLAGAGLLDLVPGGPKGLDLPQLHGTYWPHQANFERLQRSDLDWRLLCPGPLVEGPPLGVEQLRVSLDVLPDALPGPGKEQPAPFLLPLLGTAIRRLVIPSTDAAAFMLGNLERGGPLARRRVGLASRSPEAER